MPKTRLTIQATPHKFWLSPGPPIAPVRILNPDGSLREEVSALEWIRRREAISPRRRRTPGERAKQRRAPRGRGVNRGSSLRRAQA